MDGAKDLTLGQLLDKAIQSSDEVNDAPSPNDPKVQELIHLTLSHLNLCSSLIQHLALLSPNETLEDLNTGDLRCLIVDGLKGEMEVLVRTRGGEERKIHLTKARTHFDSYISLCEQYEILPPSQKKLFSPSSRETTDQGARRQNKISQYKLEKEIKAKLTELQARRSASSSSEDADAYDDDYSRPLYINLLTLHYLKARTEMGHIHAELEILKAAPPMSDVITGPSRAEEDQTGRTRGEGEDSMWKLDRPPGPDWDGRLLDDSGRILRPFTILPSTSSGTSTRLRLQSEVFQPSHRLPTMTIDEYLESEHAMGNVLQGGGPASSEAVRNDRADKKAEKENDTFAGYEAEEKEVQKSRDWDDWKDTHRKGDGNRMNRS